MFVCIVSLKFSLYNEPIEADLLHVKTSKHSNLGIRTIVHQNQVIGSYTMIGMGSIITRKKIVKPGYVFYGKPIKLIKKNNISLNKNKINSKSLTAEFLRYKKLKKNI